MEGTFAPTGYLRLLAMSKIRRVDYFPDELIAGTAGKMDAVDFGVYWMVCTLIYSRGGPIDNDHVWLAGLFRGTHWRVIRASLDRLIGGGKVSQEGGKLMVKRCADELQKVGKRIAEASQSGRKGGRPNKEINNLEKANGLSDEKLTTNQQPATNNQQPTEKKEEDAPGAKQYAWKGNVIRLEADDFAKLKKTYRAIPDFEAELFAADAYYTDNPPKDGKWYWPVMGWLKREHQKHAAGDKKSDDFNSMFPGS